MQNLVIRNIGSMKKTLEYLRQFRPRWQSGRLEKCIIGITISLLRCVIIKICISSMTFFLHRLKAKARGEHRLLWSIGMF